MATTWSAYVCLAMACLASACGRAVSTQPEIGSDLYAVAPESVIEVLLSGSEESLWAHRWRKSDRFSLVFARRGSPKPETCSAGPGFDAWLQSLSRVTIVRSQTSKVSEAGEGWFDVRLKDDLTLEPIETHLRLPTAADKSAVVAVAGKQFLVTLGSAGEPPDLRLGCAALGAR